MRVARVAESQQPIEWPAGERSFSPSKPHERTKAPPQAIRAATAEIGNASQREHTGGSSSMAIDG